MEKTKKVITEYKHDPTKLLRINPWPLEDNLTNLPTDLRELVTYFESIIDEGFTHFKPDVSGGDGYGTATLSYFKEREETDEEFQTRLKVEQEREEREERRKRTIAELTPEQREALGIRQYTA